MINILSKELDIWINKWWFKEFVAIAINFNNVVGN